MVQVDNLSRVTRDNYHMLSIMAELHFNGVRVVSVADGLDTGDEEAKPGICSRERAGQANVKNASWRMRVRMEISHTSQMQMHGLHPENQSPR